MDSHKGSCRPRCWCGQVLGATLLGATDDSTTCCSIACYERVYEASEDLRIRKHEYAILSESVDDIHQSMSRVYRKIERQVKKLRAYGRKWLSTSSDEKLRLIEVRERRSARILSRLNKLCWKRDELVKPKEQELFELEQELLRLKRIVGEE